MELLRCDNCGHVAPRDSLGAGKIRFQLDSISYGSERITWHACTWSCLASIAAREGERPMVADRGSRDLSGVS